MIKVKDYVTPPSGIKIKLSGIFDFEKLYKELHQWFIENKYEFNETKCADKTLSEGHQIVVKWKNYREVTDYIKFNMTVEMLGFRMWPVKYKGKELKKGEMELTFTSWLDYDYKKRWQSTKVGTFLINIYNNYVIKYKLRDKYEFKMYKETMEARDLGKKILNLYTEK